MTTQNTASFVQIIWLDPSQNENIALVKPLPLTIGRKDEAHTVGLRSQFVSDQHARLEWQDNQLVIVDLGSKNGTYIEGERITAATALSPSTSFRIGPYIFMSEVVGPAAEEQGIVNPLSTQTLAYPAGQKEKIPTQVAPLVKPSKPIAKRFKPVPDKQESTGLTFDPLTDDLTVPLAGVQPERDPLPALFKRQIVPVAALSKIAPVETTTYLTIGGGIGSFTWVDHLVISGADPSQVMAIGFEAKPYGRYQRLCRNSQIPGHERLRSNSDSCPDNVWGWPGYAVREMGTDVVHGQLGHALKVGWQIFNEPFVQTYTPLAHNVFASLDREANRIGWSKIWRQGRVRAIRKTDDSRYVVAYSHLSGDGPSQHRLVICNYLHLAVGYPGVRFLPDLQAYRQNTGDFRRVVNAYENHDHVYDRLKEKSGVVLIRGRGIVSSRIIQRLRELRQESKAPIRILHLMRTPLSEGNRYKRSQREVDNHWEFQPFNWPKAAWGGELCGLLNQADEDKRAMLLQAWGGTTTADRKDWREMIEQGLREGWYEIQFGNVQQVTPDPSGRIATTIQSASGIEREIILLADYIIDATGLDSDIESSPLLKDLAGHYDLPRNSQRRLPVNPNFELATLRNDTGRVYAAGISTLGGPYAPVDSFLGL
jgi:pSer/pThr/pTyr-binding forkhead associated (FHA) protein